MSQHDYKFLNWHGRFQTGGGGGGACGSEPIPERSQKIGFHSKTGPDPLKNRKATRPEFNVSALSGRQ